MSRETSNSEGDRYRRILSEYATRVSWDSLPVEAVHEVKRRTLDSIGVAIAAYDDDAPSAARAYASGLTHPDGATVWGLGAKVVPEAAAFANGVMVRYLDYNDTYLSLEPLHPSDVLPGLMALSQYRRRSARDFITGAAVAYEVGVSLCDAASIRAHRWDHVMYTSIGAVCGAGNLLGLNETQTANAIAITVVPHAPMRQTRAGELSMWKGAAAARAVSHAVFAGLLAGEGFTGPDMPFVGEMGFFRQLLGGGSFDPAALESIEQGRAPRRIVDTEKWAPKTRETADHSLPYIVAAALIDGTVTKESFSDERLRDPELASLLGKTTLSEDDRLTEGYPRGIPNRVRVTTAAGRSAERTVSFPRGHAMNPMTDDELVSKFVGNVADRWPERKARDVVDLVWNLESQPDLEGLMEAIRL